MFSGKVRKKSGRIFLIGFFLSLLWVLLHPVRPLPLPQQEVTRLTTDEPRAIEKVRAQIGSDGATSIVFLGDSLLFSSASRDDYDTIASSFVRNLNRMLPHRNIRVYDLSLPGCSFINTLEILRYVLKAEPEMVIIDVNIGWFSSNKPPEHPVLANLNLDEKNHFLKAQPVPNFPEELYRPWYEKDFSHLGNSHAKLGRFSRNNAQYLAFLEILRLLENEKGTEAVLFLPPRNRDLYLKYHLVDDGDLSQVYLELKTLTKKPILDYTWSIKSECFSDPHHMLPEGNRQLGRLLAEDVVRIMVERQGREWVDMTMDRK